MGDILGIGCTHAPHLQFRDEFMADILRRSMADERTPAQLRSPDGWPEPMRQEWGTDEGLTSAANHRATLVEGFREARRVLDDFKPDLVLIWGDDQYENFHEDVVPPFCIYALDQIPFEPFKASGIMFGQANVWGKPVDTRVMMPGHQEAAGHLGQRLIEEGFDVAVAYKLLHAQVANHAFVRTVLYLDYDQRGFPYPIIPFHVNCYGSDLWRNVRQAPPSVPAPPSPPPWRCYDLGRTVARIFENSPWRVAVVGSSSWSHAFLTKKHHGVYPDVESDRRRYEEIVNGRMQSWRDLTLEQIRDAGQHEILNWVCLAGAMDGRPGQVAAYSETYIFNSSKAVVVFPTRVPAAA